MNNEPIVERVCDPEILPLEIWDLCLARTTLGKWSHDPGFPAALATAVEIMRAGDGATQSTGALPPIVAGFEALFLAGGRIQTNDALRGLTSSCPVFLSDDGTFAAGSGGFELLKSRGLSGWVVDLGQSQLKIITPKGRWAFPRDRTRLRRAGQILPPEISSQRRRLREFIALNLQLVMTRVGPPSALVFGLPARIQADGTPHSSTYAGMRHDRTLLTDVLTLAGLQAIPIFVLNDAELAGFTARCDQRVSSFKKILVLTLGYGIGAALVNRT